MLDICFAGSHPDEAALVCTKSAQAEARATCGTFRAAATSALGNGQGSVISSALADRRSIPGFAALLPMVEMARPERFERPTLRLVVGISSVVLLLNFAICSI